MEVHQVWLFKCYSSQVLDVEPSENLDMSTLPADFTHCFNQLLLPTCNMLGVRIIAAMQIFIMSCPFLQNYYAWDQTKPAREI